MAKRHRTQQEAEAHAELANQVPGNGHHVARQHTDPVSGETWWVVVKVG